MKNLIAVITLAFFLLPFSLNSQFLTGFGVKGGATFGDQNVKLKLFDFDYETKLILGFNAGLFAEMLNNKTFNLVLESGYEQRGHTIEMIRTDEFGTEIGRDDFKYRTHYITIGALGKIKYETKSVSPYLIIGPRLDVYLGYKVTYPDDLFLGIDDEFKSEIHENTKELNYSLNLGAGLQFEKLLPFKTLVEFNYSPAINSSYNSRGAIVKDHYFNIKLGINFIKEKSKKSKK
jgi:hypothetical protein